MTRASRSDGEATRRRIFATALSLFRDHGFQGTTMREIARASGMSLGATYHHFDSKQAIVAEYFVARHLEHAQALAEALPKADGLRERIALTLHLGLDVRAPDRVLMRELMPFALGSEASLSAFASPLSSLRDSAIGLYREAVQEESVPQDIREALALALWALQFGMYLYFVHDESPRQQRTRVLVDEAVDLVVMVLRFVALPPMEPVRAQLRRVLADAGLLEPQPAAR